MTAISSPDTVPATMPTHLGSFRSGFMPGLWPCFVRFAAICDFVLFLSPWPISDLGLGSLQSGQRRASVGTSIWHLGHFIDNPHGAIWCTLAVCGPAAAMGCDDHCGEYLLAFSSNFAGLHRRALHLKSRFLSAALEFCHRSGSRERRTQSSTKIILPRRRPARACESGLTKKTCASIVCRLG